MSRKRREKKESDGLPKNLLCNKSDEELIKLINIIQDGINSESFTAYDILLKDTIVETLGDRGYVVSEVLVIEHASELAPEKCWGDKKDKGEDEGDKKQESTKEIVVAEGPDN